MAWRITEIPDSEATEDDLTDGELVGVSIILTQNMGEPYDNINVYYRAWEKIQPKGMLAAERMSQ